MKPILLEVVAPMLTTVEWSGWQSQLMIDTLGLRRNSRQSCIDEYPEDWKQAGDYVSNWIREITNLYRHRIKIILIDAQSPMGMWKQIRYRLFKFPAFIVDKKLTYIGWDHRQLETLIDQRIHA
ncbi:MAG: hypothetical protein PVF56_02640 [Desulfobacterales bacterium]|jgi:hypothetical protein